MPSRGIPTTYPAPPFAETANGLTGPSPRLPVPCSNVIFSSSVIAFTTSEARSSGERLVFVHGCFPPDWAEAATKLKVKIRIASERDRQENGFVRAYRGIRGASLKVSTKSIM